MAKKKIEIPKEVADFLGLCSKFVGDDARDTFDQSTFCEFLDLSIDSPIEQFFYTSIKAVAALQSIPLADLLRIGKQDVPFGLSIQPQRQIKSYRVDFYISWQGYTCLPMKNEKCVVVECDSQQWHERTEAERRYEKKRDRELSKLGLHTFRFTGKEIKEAPFSPAIEVLEFLTGQSIQSFHDQIHSLSEVE